MNAPVLLAVLTGKDGPRLGGLEVEICGLKVTLRAGFTGGVGRGEDWVGRRGVVSDILVRDEAKGPL